MPSIASLLHSIEADSGLSRSDALPLFRYHVSNGRLTELRGALREALQRGWDSDSLIAAGFVLYAACSFCRDYAGGPWAWKTILEPLGVSERLGETELVVTRGLKWWGREVGHSGRRFEYLYTLAREGGLPLSVVREQGGGRLREYLRRLLLRRESTIGQTRDLAEELIGILPRSLRHDIVVDVTSELIDAVARLRRAAPRAYPDIAEWLETNQPGWRSELPVHLEEDVAEKLIRGLVTETPMGIEVPEGDFRLVTELHATPRLGLLCHVAFPKSLTVEELKATLGSTEDLPTRVVVQVSNEDGEQTALAVGSRQGDLFAFRSLGPRHFPAKARGGSTQLVVTGAGRTLGLIPLSGGEAASDSLPWVFHHAEVEALPRVRERSSARRTGAAILVALPDGKGTLTVEGKSQELGVESTTQRRIVRLSGEARWTNAEGEVFTFVTDMADNGCEYSLHGRLMQLPGGQTAWLGVPRLRERSEKGDTRDLTPAELRWRSVGTGHSWRILGSECLGDVHLRVQSRSGVASFHTRVTVLPKDFEARLLPKTRNSGCFEFSSRSLAAVHPRGDGISSEVQSSRSGVVKVSLTAEPAPRDVAIRLSFVGGAGCTLRLPFPSVTYGFENSKGELLKRGTRIALDQLRCYRAVARSSESSSGFVLEAKAQGTWRSIGPLVEDGLGSKSWCLGLSAVSAQLESALDGSSGVDAACALRVVPLIGSVNRRAEQDGSIALGWHELQLDVQVGLERTLVRVDANALTNLTTHQRANFTVKVQRLHHPDEPFEDLKEESDCLWSFAPGVERKGPWLFSGWLFGQLVTRPRMQRIGADEQSDEYADAFEHVLRIAESEERRHLLKKAAGSAAFNVADSLWQRLDAFLNTLSILPPVTYDVNYAIAKNPALAVLAAMRANASRFESVWEGLERLGIVWSATSIRYWAAGVRAYVKWEDANQELLGILGGRTAAVRRRLPGLFVQSVSQPRFFSVINSALCRKLSLLPPTENDSVAFGSTAVGRAQLAQIFNLVRTAHLGRQFGAGFNAPRGAFEQIFERAQYPMQVMGLLDALNATDHPEWEGLTVAPLAAAYVMANDIPPERELLRELRYFRAMDEEWFDVAHASALAVFLGELLEQNNDYLDQF
jgi:hypothetical protein